LETPPPCKGDWGKAASVLVSEFIRARAKNPALAMPDADKLRELAQSCVVTSAEVFGRDCKRLHEKAAFLALDDPASIARDLSELLDNRYIAFTRYTDFGRPLVTSKAIEQACMAIHDQAELKWLDKRQKKLEMFHSAIWISNSGNSYSRNAKYVGTPSEIPPEKPSIMTDANWTEFNELHMYLDTDEEVGERDASGIWTPAQRTRCEQIRANRVNELAQARDKAWKTYAKHLKNQGKACDEFRETYEKEKAVFNDAIILPLSEAHVKWTSGKTLAAVSRYMFDKEELRAGVIFAMMISKIIGGTQKYTPTATLYEKWLGDEAWMEKKDDTTNLLWKALLVNNSHMEAGLAKATKDLQAEFPSNRYSAEAMAHAAEREKALDSNEQVEQAVTARKEAWKEDASFGDGLKEGSAGKAFLGIGEKLVGRYFDIYGKLEETMWEAIAATLKGETHTVNARGKSGALQQQWSDCITDVVNRLVGVLSGPAVNVINSRTQMGTYAPLLVHCGAISRAPYFFVQCYGTTAQMAESILWTMQREGLGLAEMAENQKRALRSAIQQRLTALQINGVNLNGQAPRLIPVAISFRALEKFIKSGKPAAQQAALFRLIAGMERMPYLAMEAMRAGRFDEAVRIAQANGAQLREIMRTRWDLRLRVWGSGLIKHSAVQAVVAVFSVAEITGGAEKIVKAQRLGHGAAEAITRLLAACLSFAQTLFIAAEKSLSALPTMFLRFGVRDPATAALWWADKAEWAGRFVSGVLVVASGFMALEAFSERDYMMSALYGISAITAGITLALSIAGVAGGPAGLLLFIASILIIAAIEIAKGDPFENWMKKCWFGTEEPKYDTIAQEMEEFSDAFAKAQIA
ncbi:MAG: hypothetical protein LBF93_12895, partial [Zoogloeaceae bacterium]|nr:hypothetical protein [Zoogloeaceae bacterium]